MGDGFARRDGRCVQATCVEARLTVVKAALGLEADHNVLIENGWVRRLGRDIP